MINTTFYNKQKLKKIMTAKTVWQKIHEILHTEKEHKHNHEKMRKNKSL
jgi:hypothetical protein